MSRCELYDEMIAKAKSFNENHLFPIAKKLDDENRPPVELFQIMKNEGFFGMNYAKEYGGGDLSSKTTYDVYTEIAKASAGVALTLHVHYMAIDAILKFGTEEQKDLWLPKLVSGEKIGAYSISEVEAGSDAASLTCVATKTDDGYVLNGSKYFCTNGEIADIYVVAVKTDIDAGGKGISVLIVEKESEGMTISKPLDKTGCRSSITTAVNFKDCFVRAENLLGAENGGFKVAMYGLISGRLGMASMGIGIAEACLNEACKYANKRIAFGKPISALYSIQEKIANMHTKIEVAKSYMDTVTEKRDKGIDYSLESSIIKVFVAQTVNEVCHGAIQVFGGHGYIKSANVERYSRDGRLMDIGVGATEVLNMVIGSSILRSKK